MKFTDLLDEFGIPYREHGESGKVTSGFIGLDCPFCGPRSGKFNLGYNLEKRFCVCWVCGPHRTVEVVAALTGKSIPASYDLIGGIDFQKFRGVKLTGKLELPRGVGPLLSSHKNYLRRRRFDPAELARLWRIQGIGRHGDVPFSLFIPVMWRGETVSWTLRVCSDKAERRYKAARPDQERLSAKSVLYGGDYVRHTAIICEGPTDVWRLGPGAVATMGLSYSKEQVGEIAKFSRRIICFDNAPVAQRRARKLADALSVLPGETLVASMSSADPGSAGADEVREIRERFLDE